MKFKVYEKSTGKDVTEKLEWYIDCDGDLFFMTDDIDCPLNDSTEEYYYKLEFEQPPKPNVPTYLEGKIITVMKN